MTLFPLKSVIVTTKALLKYRFGVKNTSCTIYSDTLPNRGILQILVAQGLVQKEER